MPRAASGRPAERVHIMKCLMLVGVEEVADPIEVRPFFDWDAEE